MSRPKTGSRERVDFKKEWIQTLLSAKVQIFRFLGAVAPLGLAMIISQHF